MSSQSWSLDKWAAQHAPLDESQRASAARLAAWQSRRPSVWHQQPVSRDPAPAPRPEEHDARRHVPPTDEEAGEAKTPSSAVTLPVKVQSEAVLSRWLDALREEEASVREAQLEASLQTVTNALQWAEGVLSTATIAETHVQTLSALSTHVRTSTTPIRASSSAAVEALDRLAQLAQDIEDRKTYFDVLTPVTRLLSAPSPDLALVASSEFHETWDQIDRGLRFTMAHPTYAEAARYHALFQHSAVRAASLTRMWLARYVSHWTEGSARALNRGGNEKKEMFESPLVLDALFGSEGTKAPLVRSLFRQLEARARAPSDPSEGEDKVGVPEIRPILIECRDIVYSSRESLLSPVVTTLLSDVVAASLSSSIGRRDSEQRMAPIWSILASVTEVADKEAAACCGLLDTVSISFGKESAREAFSMHLVSTFSHAVERATEQALQALIPSGQTSADDVVRILTPLLRDLLQRAKALATDNPEHVTYAYRPILERVRVVLLRAIEGKVRAIAGYTPKAGDLAYPDRIARTHSAQAHSPALQSKEDADSLALPANAHHRETSIGGAGVLDAAILGDKADNGLASPSAEEAGLFLLPPGEAGQTLAGEVGGTWYAPFKSGFLLLSRTWDVLDEQSLTQVGEIVSTGVLQAVKAGAGRLAAAKAADAEAETQARDGVVLGDATLFLLRHVLLLRETVASIHVAAERARSDSLTKLLRSACPSVEDETLARASTMDLASVVGTLHSLWSGSFWRGHAPENKGKEKEQRDVVSSLANAPLEFELHSITSRLVERACAPFSAFLAGGKDEGANALAQKSLEQASNQLRQYLDDGAACRTLLSAAADEMQRLWATRHAEPLVLNV